MDEDTSRAPDANDDEMTWLRGNPLFKTREGLEAEIARLGLDIRLEPSIEQALTPFTIAGRTVPNRFVVHPMEGCDGTLDGRPDEITYHRWGRFARGGAKLIWGEAVAVLSEARANPRQLWLSDANEPDFGSLIAFARKEHRDACGGDVLIGLQLTHSGRWSYPNPIVPARTPSLDRVRGLDAPVLTDDELEAIQDAYVAVAVRARDCGADFVDVKQCHGYLLSEMLGARHRPGRYGGDLEARTSFAREIVRRIRDAVGDDMFVATRMNVFDGIPFMRDGVPRDVELPYRCAFGAREDRPTEPDLREPIDAIHMLREDGISLVNVTAGCPYHNPHIGRPADKPPVDGYDAPEPELAGVARHFALTRGIQQAFPDLPVVGTGYSYLRHYAGMAAEANIRAGHVTLAGLGRGSIAYPDFAKDIAESGEMQWRKSCITVSHCTTLMRAKGNEFGQYAAGCVPRDPLYAKLLQEINAAKREAAVEAP